MATTTPPAAEAAPAALPAATKLRARVAAAVAAGNGCLLAAAPAIVFRGTYAGRDIIGPNSTYAPENVDARGYVPVEWWIMSKTVALNPVCKDHEGVTRLQLGGGSDGGGGGDGGDGEDGDGDGGSGIEGTDNSVRFNDAVECAGDLLLGAYVKRWPLTKVLDIGGAPVKPRFIPGSDADLLATLEAEGRQAGADDPTNSRGGAAEAAAEAASKEKAAGGEAGARQEGDEAAAAKKGGKETEEEEEEETEAVAAEFPPIPCHVHCGDFGGSGSGKLEAYFFPPLDVPPYNLNVGGSVRTRLGLKPSVTKDAVVGAMRRFGVDDSMYQLLNEYPVKARETWTIPTHVIHAPGPWTTFEIQLPQDDFNLFAWQLGQAVPNPEERAKCKKDFQLRGYASERELLDASLKWSLNVDPKFEKRWRHDCEVLEEGAWGRRLRLFYNEFYGEGFEVAPGQTFTRAADSRPFAGITWSGHGTLNDAHALSMDAPSQREFLVTPNTPVELRNTGSLPLLVYCVFPFDLEAKLSTTEIGRLVQGHAGHGAGCGC